MAGLPGQVLDKGAVAALHVRSIVAGVHVVASQVPAASQVPSQVRRYLDGLFSEAERRLDGRGGSFLNRRRGARLVATFVLLRQCRLCRQVLGPGFNHACPRLVISAAGLSDQAEEAKTQHPSNDLEAEEKRHGGACEQEPGRVGHLCPAACLRVEDLDAAKRHAKIGLDRNELEVGESARPVTSEEEAVAQWLRAVYFRDDVWERAALRQARDHRFD
mmetsp:Transcript_48998/g.138613  ORF Transcript_48998/g.138613 Transcript_48998/m.138613 type:complete len:218 (-) Transcript_48998:333-986(-)